ncbi:MAG: tetratricopeptide repeat protein [Rhizobacter sp.]|nr:tetratricopeptide repeat protein [Chlorobiales bacterium]
MSAVRPARRGAASVAAGKKLRAVVQKVDRLCARSVAAQHSDPKNAVRTAGEAATLARRINYHSGLAHALFALGNAEYLMSEYQSTLRHLSEALALFAELGDVVNQVSVFKLQGNVFWRQGDFVRALEHQFKSFALLEGTNQLEAEAGVHNNIGVVYSELGDYEKALHHFFEALRLRETLGDKAKLPAVLGNIGSMYGLMNDYDNTLRYSHRVLSLSKETGDRRRVASAMSTIGNAHLQNHHLDEALKYHRRALKIFSELADHYGESISLLSLAETYLEQGKAEEAVKFSMHSIKHARLFGDKIVEASCLYMLGRCHLQAGDVDQACTALGDALARTTQTGAKSDIYKIHETFAEAYKRQGNYEKALYHFEQFHRVRLEIYNEEAARRQKQLEVSFALERLEKEKEIYRLKAAELETEMHHKTRELSTLALNLVEKNELLGALRQGLSQLLRAGGRDAAGSLQHLYDQVSGNLDTEKVWQSFEHQFNDVHQNFIRTLSEKFPLLTPAELKVCTLLKLNLSNKEISQLLFTTLRNIETHRYRLRKKLSLRTDTNLVSFLSSL